MRLSGARRKIRHYRPKRPFFSRIGLPGRAASPYLPALENLTTLAAGGIYFLEPGMLGGLYPRDT